MAMHTNVQLKLCIGMFIEAIPPNREKWEISQMFINIWIYEIVILLEHYASLNINSPSVIHYCPEEARHKILYSLNTIIKFKTVKNNLCQKSWLLSDVKNNGGKTSRERNWG